LKRKKLTPDGDPGVQIFCPQILMRHIQSSQSRAPQKKKMIVEQSRNHPNLFIITSASLPTNISTIFKGPFKKTEFKHVLYEFSFSHKNERSQKSIFS